MKINKGFALLEVVLAVVVVLTVSIGGVYLYQSGSDQTNFTSAEQELNQIAYTYSQLAGNGLTAGFTTEAQLVSLLQNSRQLSAAFFSDSSGTLKIVTPFSELTFDPVSPFSFVVSVPLGAMRTGGQVSAFYSAIEDNYQCSYGCIDADDTDDIDYTGSNFVNLTFDMSN